MPFVIDRPFDEHIDGLAAQRCVRAIAEAGGARLERNIRELTPVDESPYRFKPARPRGTLKASVHAEGVEPHRSSRGVGWQRRVVTDDPVAPYVEWTTRPHEIRPRRPGGRLHWQDSHGHHYATLVHHPGTKGQHMFSRGAAVTERELPQIAAEPLRQFARELVR